jgi:hypothetical protein
MDGQSDSVEGLGRKEENRRKNFSHFRECIHYHEQDAGKIWSQKKNAEQFAGNEE